MNQKKSTLLAIKIADKLLKAFDIYTVELEEFLSGKNENHSDI